MTGFLHSATNIKCKRIGIKDGSTRYRFSPTKGLPKSSDEGAYAPWANPMGRGTSAVNITKGSEIAVVKELQPSVIQSCCSEDRHRNNQVDIKSKATTKYLQMLIY